MKRLLILLAAALALASPAAAQERAIVDASAPSDLSVTIYRDPERSVGEEMETNWPQGFAMISETRTVILPPGQSTVRFEGVAEGMVSVSAIVTGLPGGTIEKNRNAELLSPAALVNGALGNRITITRTNPATGEQTSERAVVRTRADGGLMLQSSAGYEAVRCAGVPERLTFDRIPSGLSAKPVFSINTQDANGGTYEVTLTYLAWGFDWQADYIATLTGEGRRDWFEMNLLSWLSLVNDNGQSFENAQLLVIAGTLNVESDFEGLSDPPTAAPLRLTCYPLGNTKQGSPLQSPVATLPLAEAEMMESRAGEMIVVTGARKSTADMMYSPGSVMEAGEERLGDLKLYRVPERVTVSAKGLKQVAFLNRQDVQARYLYVASCGPYNWFDPEEEFRSADMLLVTKNEDRRGLGVSLPQGMMTVFEPSAFGPQLVAETELRDYARGQEIELDLPRSNQVNFQCGRVVDNLDVDNNDRQWVEMKGEVRNANPHPVTMRVMLGQSVDWDVRIRRVKSSVKNGFRIAEFKVPANATREFRWKVRSSAEE
ncbi:DUF4139 domain-containing protein [Erythrobacter sp. THAF29]|uniref:DUF4139 domain-containing protein n=1 Tax=Erythrobacter sp. THAF29 TaxID=2587851 RepID=UPI001267D4FD|nr:hypothetical protein [Erythrobacter sp. THAF29]QFT78200.1 hypothetical protein FIU90_11685 [Erythrobacter sp. THAF29]